MITNIETTILVSVIMPAYNAEKFIEESIMSVITQTYHKLELIIIDDGSIDNTKTIILKLAASDSRIIYLYQKNCGQGSARNTGIRKAKGDLIAFLDADDLWVREKLEKQVNLFYQNLNDVLFGDAIMIDEEGKTLKNSWNVKSEIFEGKEGIASFLKRNKIPLLTALVKKNAVIRIGGFKESNKSQYGEDYDLWMRLLVSGAVFRSVSDLIGAYRSHKHQSTRNKNCMIEVLQNLQNLSLSEYGLRNQKKKAMKIWIKRFVRSNEILDKESIHQLTCFYPGTFRRWFIQIVNRATRFHFYKQIFLLVC